MDVDGGSTTDGSGGVRTGSSSGEEAWQQQLDRADAFHDRRRRGRRFVVMTHLQARRAKCARASVDWRRRGLQFREASPPPPPPPVLRGGPQGQKPLQPMDGWPSEVDATVGAIWSAQTPHHIPPHPTTNQILLFAGVVAGS